MAYAAITSLMRTIDQSMQLTGCNLQSFHEKFESLRAILEKTCLKTGHLEALTSLEAEIIVLVGSTEDLIDSESRKFFLAENEITRKIEFWELRFLLKQALGHIDSSMNKWMETKLDMEDLKPQVLDLSDGSEYVFEPDGNTMVGHENEFEMLQDQLARGGSELQVVSIVGMGGIGKTTLANKIYSDPFIMSHFDIRANATVSQRYCARVVLVGLLSCVSGETDEFHEQQDDGQLAERLQKLLKQRRYLVVIDDIWTNGAWDDIKLCFPDSNCGSRILLTTRDMEVAEYASSSKPPYRMRLMNFDESWRLLCEKVFANGFFPPELEQIGEKIALECRGLPLAIVVIAGLLSKTGKALDEWKDVAENVRSRVTTNLDAPCLRVLALSYYHLPHHLKACFLYFAIFAEDEVIFVDKLMELWVVEGFLKVEETKSIKEVAQRCLKDLIDRSLIFVHHLSFDGKLKSCRIHDVIREFCLKEARNMNFLNDARGKNDQTTTYAQSMHISSKSRGRISIQNGEELARCGSSDARSVFLFYRYRGFKPELSRFKLVRVLDLALLRCSTFPSWVLDLIHLRYLALTLSPGLQSYLPSSLDIPLSISSLHYLQTFILKVSHHEVSQYPFILPSDILSMPQLNHLCLDWNYLRYHNPTEKSLVLKNLHSLSGWNPLFCTWSVFRLLPNLNKLQVCGIREDLRDSKDILYFRYLDQLEELEFHVATPKHLPPADDFPLLVLPSSGAFPENLKSLAFKGTLLLWEDLSIVGKLPKLEVLKLAYDACVGVEWEVVEEGFPRLKFLLLKRLGIRYWRASSTHFPCLQRLFVKACWYLDSIPEDFAEITTLELIDISGCAQSVGNSAKQIQHDIEDNYASSVEVHIS